MTKVRDTVNASGAGEAFVRLVAALQIRPSAEAHRLKEGGVAVRLDER